jgi:hypothetical protein
MLAYLFQLGHNSGRIRRLHSRLSGEQWMCSDLNPADTLFKTWYAWAALLNVISDVAIMIIPIPFILPLNMPRKQKATTIGLITTAIM